MTLLQLYTSRAGSLVHPFSMAVLVVLYVWTFFLGYQARQKRLYPRAEESGLLTGMVTDHRHHHKLSAALVFLTTAMCFFGMGNTFARSARLFPGPHLWGGLAVLFALSFNVMLVPWFKGDHRFRIVHAVVGASIMVLLANQVKSGIPILVSVWKTVR